MDVESRLGRALARAGDTVQPDVAGALRDVHTRDRRRTTRHRVTVAGSVAAVALAAGAVVWLGASGLDDGREPVSPSGDGERGASLSVVRERSAASLGLRKLLRVAVGPGGRVYVTDSSQRVAELSPDLEVVRTWGSTGDGAGELRMVQGSIAVDDEGRVYVTDTGNFRVQVFSANGRYLRSIGEFGTGPGQFTWPFDLVVDQEGNLYVSDDKEQTLAKLSPDGRQIGRRGGLGETDPRLQGHAHLATLDQQGNLVVVIDDTGVVAQVSQDGSVAGTLDVESEPSAVCDATVDPAGRYYLTSCLEPWVVRIIGPDGTPAASWDDVEVVLSPRWTPDGRGYAVTAEGGIVEVRAGAG